MVKNADMKRSLLLLDLWRRDVAMGRGDVEAVVWSNSLARASLHALGGLMGVW
ncbi:hypothetical protein V8921_20620 [Ralstonia mannitolilytica]|uniref:hypothetical protein n=1 Tax=Ralstonia mannitolilytica TaxID=105219 RepID=UPI0013157E1E|nr:hypothetical protein [Ralstonia mannitolilytica]